MQAAVTRGIARAHPKGCSVALKQLNKLMARTRMPTHAHTHAHMHTRTLIGTRTHTRAHSHAFTNACTRRTWGWNMLILWQVSCSSADMSGLLWWCILRCDWR